MTTYKKKVFAVIITLSFLFLAFTLRELANYPVVSVPGENAYWIAATDTPLPSPTPEPLDDLPPGACYGDPNDEPTDACQYYVPPKPTATPFPTPTPYVRRGSFYKTQPILLNNGTVVVAFAQVTAESYRGKTFAIIHYYLWNNTGETVYVPYVNMWYIPTIHLEGHDYMFSYYWDDIGTDYVTKHVPNIESLDDVRFFIAIPPDRQPHALTGVVEFPYELKFPSGGLFSFSDGIPEEIIPRVMLFTDGAVSDFLNTTAIAFFNKPPHDRCDPETPPNTPGCFYHAEIDPATINAISINPFPQVIDSKLISSEESAAYWANNLGAPESVRSSSERPAKDTPNYVHVGTNGMVPNFILNGALVSPLGGSITVTQPYGPTYYDYNESGVNCCSYLRPYSIEDCRCPGTLEISGCSTEEKLSAACHARTSFSQKCDRNVPLGCSHHMGIDFHADMGSPVYSIINGKVAFMVTANSKYDTGYGNFVCTVSNEPYAPKNSYICVCYAHLEAISDTLYRGAEVSRYQVIGLSGNTGNSSGPHLHLEVRLSPDGQSCPAGSDFDPMQLLRNPFAFPSDGDEGLLLTMQKYQDRLAIYNQIAASPYCQTDASCASKLNEVISKYNQLLEEVRMQLFHMGYTSEDLARRDGMKPAVSLTGGFYRKDDETNVVVP